jgi:DNA-binding transcriptional MocR family regulator
MVMTAIRQRIAGRSLTPGARLPSIRRLATALKVSPSAVVEAYERLVAEGAINSRPGSGFYLASQAAPLSLAEIGPRLDRAVDPFWVSRQSLESSDGVLKPGCGWLPPSWLPEDSIRRALRGLSRASGPVLADYGSPLGLPALRRHVARRMAERGIECAPDQIMLTESGTQAMDLLFRFLIEPGDTVLLDDPCYFNFQALLRAHRAKMVGVPHTPSGPDIALFADSLATHRPRRYITNSAIHNPTGATLQPAIAHRLLKLAEQHDLIIVEDDIFADLRPRSLTRIATLDQLRCTIYIGSFSKSVSAALRVGFLACNAALASDLADVKMLTHVSSSEYCERTLDAIVGDGHFLRHTNRLQDRLKRATATGVEALTRLGATIFKVSDQSLYLWARLPGPDDSIAFAKEMLGKHVILAPGTIFSAHANIVSPWFRFNVAYLGDPRFSNALAP